MAANAKAGGNSRKKGRMLAWCQSYKNRQQRERNKARKLARHLRREPNDAVSRAVLTALPDGFRKGLTFPEAPL